MRYCFSGDDGVANHNVRDYPVESCRRSLPAWPASSPYVTAVGGTQLSPQYLPVCGMEFYKWEYSNSIMKHAYLVSIQ